MKIAAGEQKCHRRDDICVREDLPRDGWNMASGLEEWIGDDERDDNHHYCETRDEAGPPHGVSSPNGFELTGAGLAPRCLDDKRAAGVRCSEGLGEAFTE